MCRKQREEQIYLRANFKLFFNDELGNQTEWSNENELIALDLWISQAMEHSPLLNTNPFQNLMINNFISGT